MRIEILIFQHSATRFGGGVTGIIISLKKVKKKTPSLTNEEVLVERTQNDVYKAIFYTGSRTAAVSKITNGKNNLL